MVERLRGPQECPPEIRLPFVLRHHYSQGTNGLLGPCLVTVLDGDNKWDEGQPAATLGLTSKTPEGSLGASSIHHTKDFKEGKVRYKTQRSCSHECDAVEKAEFEVKEIRL